MDLPLRKDRRIIKTHLPFTLLPQNLFKSGCKIIYVVRNPKDVIISFYYLNKLFRTQGYDGDLSKYWNYFKQNLQPWTPYWEHVKEGWDRRFEKNFLFLFYEDMNKDSKAAIKKISSFLDKTLTDQQVFQIFRIRKLR
ncbi:Sulfotransferase domain [Popillia japonica]|uniref:Sulfotransferase domain n=1 Tax=Popillia japonica TaxID=7064 RepID=A0AAW1KMC0_POPJA